MKRRSILVSGLLLAALTACSHHAPSVVAGPPASPGPAASQSANLPTGTGAGTPTVAPTATSSATPSARPTHTPGTAAACTGGAISFGTIHTPWVLTRITPPFTAPKHGGYKIPPTTAVATVNASIVAGPQVPQMTLYRAFAARASFDPDVKLLGEVYDGSDVTFGASRLVPGKYVVYRSVHAVQASFSYKCGAGEGGKPYEGFASSSLTEWAGIVNCGKALPAGSRADTKAAKAACTKSKS